MLMDKILMTREQIEASPNVALSIVRSRLGCYADVEYRMTASSMKTTYDENDWRTHVDDSARGTIRRSGTIRLRRLFPTDYIYVNCGEDNVDSMDGLIVRDTIDKKPEFEDIESISIAIARPGLGIDLNWVDVLGEIKCERPPLLVTLTERSSDKTEFYLDSFAPYCKRNDVFLESLVREQSETLPEFENRILRTIGADSEDIRPSMLIVDLNLPESFSIEGILGAFDIDSFIAYIQRFFIATRPYAGMVVVLPERWYSKHLWENRHCIRDGRRWPKHVITRPFMRISSSLYIMAY